VKTLERIIERVTQVLLRIALPLISLSGIVFLIVLLNLHADNDAALRLEAFDRDTTVVKLLIYFGADVHAKNDQALQIAAHKGDTEIVKILLDHDANVHADNDAPLYQASLYGHEDIVKMLLSHGADANTMNDRALQVAVQNDHPEVVKLLLDYGVRVSGCMDRAMIDYADRQGLTLIGKLLRERRTPAEASSALSCGANKLLETTPLDKSVTP
jgi:ankyrin repeat protein